MSLQTKIRHAHFNYRRHFFTTFSNWSRTILTGRPGTEFILTQMETRDWLSKWRRLS